MSSLPVTPAVLYPGQRLTREEFLRRWEAIPELKRAELIDGIVYMPSPVSTGHARRDTLVINWLGHYAFQTPGCEAANNATWLMLESAPQPDAALYLLPRYGGQSLTEGSLFSGAPELVAEVSGASSYYDSGPKLALYQRAGVREYISVLLDPPEVRWRVWRNGGYETAVADAGGIFRSTIFPGLWLDPEALRNNDGARLLATLQQGLDSPEHADFVRLLAARRLP
jgi:Uma2 family endonuclease